MELPSHQNRSIPLYISESAINGSGCFAAGRIRIGTIIGEYCGERIDLEEAVRRNDRSSKAYSHYVLEIERNLFVDGAKWESPLRYINHSCDPNCRVCAYDHRAYIVTIREIGIDEECTIDYCYDEEVREPCTCGSPGCRGYM